MFYDLLIIILVKRGYLNLYLFLEICVLDLDILCNFLMFFNVLDNRFLLNMINVIKDLIGGRVGLRLFGFIILVKFGLYMFIVKFCYVEVWFS